MMGLDWGVFERQVIGKPFQWNGRGPDAYDCWGLVRAGLAFAGVPVDRDWWLPEGAAARSVRVMEAEIAGGCWQRLERPVAGCVVALSTHQRIHHVALLVPSGVLQAVPDIGVCRCRFHQLRGQGYQRVECYQWR